MMHARNDIAAINAVLHDAQLELGPVPVNRLLPNVSYGNGYGDGGGRSYGCGYGDGYGNGYGDG